MPRYKLVRDQTIHIEFDKHHFFFFSPKIRPTKTHNSTSHIYPATEVPTATHVTRDQRTSGHCKIITVYNLLAGSWYTVSTRIRTTLLRSGPRWHSRFGYWNIKRSTIYSEPHSLPIIQPAQESSVCILSRRPHVRYIKGKWYTKLLIGATSLVCARLQSPQLPTI